MKRLSIAVRALGLSIVLLWSGQAALMISEDEAIPLDRPVATAPTAVPSTAPPSPSPSASPIASPSESDSPPATPARSHIPFQSLYRHAPGAILGDVDGDGSRDVVATNGVSAVNATPPETTVHVLSGTDGSDLWTHAFDDGVTGAWGVKAGPRGRPGVVVHADMKTASAYDGAGRQLWSRKLAGRLMETVGQFSAGPAEELLDWDSTSSGSASQSSVAVIDGANGRVVSTVRGPNVTGFPRFLVVGDMSGDGLADLIAVLDDTPGVNMFAYEASSGRELWRRRGPSWATDVGDMTGDGFTDLLANETTHPKERSVVISGRDGGQVLTLDAYYVRAAGDVNRDGRDDVVIRRAFKDGDTYCDVHEAYTYPKRPIYRRDDCTTIDPTYRGTVSEIQVVGDVDADRVRDFWALTKIYEPDGYTSLENGDVGVSQYRAGIVSGRTGRPLWRGGNNQWLGAAVDGRGDDFATTDTRTNMWGMVEAFVTIGRGNDGTSLWRSQCRADGDTWSGALATAGDLSGDGQADVLCVASTYTGVPGVAGRPWTAHQTLTAISSDSGKWLWTGQLSYTRCHGSTCPPG